MTTSRRTFIQIIPMAGALALLARSAHADVALSISALRCACAQYR